MTQESRFKEKPNSRFRTPEVVVNTNDDGTFVSKAVTEPVSISALESVMDIRDMDDPELPKDGTPILLTEDGETYIEAVLHKSRRYSPKDMRWLPTEVWHRRGTVEKITFDPLGWKLIE